jgi:hypothetical protein
LLAPAATEANVFLAAPFQNPDPERPMCIGVQTNPVWGDAGQYTGNCRYGAPLGLMYQSVKQMDRKVAVGRARENGLTDKLGARLQTQLDALGGLSFSIGTNRLKRYAQEETNAAGDGKDGKQSSWAKRSLINCAVWGALAATAENALNALINGKRPGKDTVKAMAAACATAVVSGPLSRWIKSKGYGMDA